MYLSPVNVNTVSNILCALSVSVNSWAIFSMPISFLVTVDLPITDLPNAFVVCNNPALYMDHAISPIWVTALDNCPIVNK